MSKIAIVLCVAIFATVADCAFDGVFNDTSNLVVGRVVNNVISKVESDMRQAHERVARQLQMVLSNIFKKSNDFSKKIMDIMAKAHVEVARVLRGDEKNPQYPKNTENECIDIQKFLWVVGGPQSRVMSKANECIVEELKHGFSHMKGIGFAYAQGLANITSIKAELEECNKIEDSYPTVDSLMAAEFCPEKVAAKAYEVSVAVIPALNTKVTFLNDWWKTAQPKFDACTSVTHLNELRKETAAVVTATKECIKATIELFKEGKEIDGRP